MTDSEIIDALGGTSEVARLCDLSTGAISQWRHNGIPKPWQKYLREIRPEAFAPVQKEAA